MTLRMTALTIELDLPEQLAEDARNAGLLSSEAIETLLREQLKKRHVDELFEMADSLAAVDLTSPPPRRSRRRRAWAARCRRRHSSSDSR